MNNIHNNLNDGQDDEFICVIRPADASFPHSHGGSQMFSSLLSTASMVAHDLELMNSAQGRERGGEPGTMGDDTHHRRGGTSSVGSSGSHNSSGEEGSSASVKPRSDISKGLFVYSFIESYLYMKFEMNSNITFIFIFTATGTSSETGSSGSDQDQDEREPL